MPKSWSTTRHMLKFARVDPDKFWILAFQHAVAMQQFTTTIDGDKSTMVACFGAPPR